MSQQVDSQALAGEQGLFSGPCPHPGVVVWLVAPGSLSALRCPLSQGGSRWPSWIALSPHWVAAVCSSAEMTPHPQLHQSFHRWSESHCKMWLQAASMLRSGASWTKPGRGLGTREREAEAGREAPAVAVGQGQGGRGTRPRRQGRGPKPVSGDRGCDHTGEPYGFLTPSPTTTPRGREKRGTSWYVL